MKAYRISLHIAFTIFQRQPKQCFQTISKVETDGFYARKQLFPAQKLKVPTLGIFTRRLLTVVRSLPVVVRSLPIVVRRLLTCVKIFLFFTPK